jgi:hypothetical protein
MVAIIIAGVWLLAGAGLIIADAPDLSLALAFALNQFWLGIHYITERLKP